MCNAASVLIIRHVSAVKPSNEPVPSNSKRAVESKAKLKTPAAPATPPFVVHAHHLPNTKPNGPLIMQRLPKAILIREPQNICHLWMVKSARHSFRMRFVHPPSPHTALSRAPLTLPRNSLCKFQRVPFAASEVGVGRKGGVRGVVGSASCEHKY